MCGQPGKICTLGKSLYNRESKSDFFSFCLIKMQKVFNFKIEPRRNITIQSYELRRVCINEILANF